MSIVTIAIAAAAGAVATVVSQTVYAFVAKQVKSVEADVPAEAAKVVADVEKKV
jgi:hypothetical protein